MKVPFLDIAATAATLRAESLAALARVYDSGVFISGTEVAAFEQECARWFLPQTRCIGVSSGTDALVCALGALGIGPGSRVLTPPLTFFATVSAIVRVGATPVFADVDERRWLLDVDAARQGRPWDAAIVVHLFGRMVDVERWRTSNAGPLIEDAAQAWGASLNGAPAGTAGDLGCFSFFPAKPLGACGDAGLVVTSDARLEAACRSLRIHGRAPTGEFDRFGGNHRLDEMQAALLRVRQSRVHTWLDARRRNAETYFTELSGLTGVILPQPDAPHDRSAWSVFSIRAPSCRDDLREFLRDRGIGTAVYYEQPAHLQPALRGQYARGDFPVAERLCEELLALPIGPELTPSQLHYVCDSVRLYFQR